MEGKPREKEREGLTPEKFHPQGLKIQSGMEVALLNTTLTLMVCTVINSVKPVDTVCVQTLLTLLNTAKTLAYMPIYIVGGRSEQYWNGLRQV